MLQPEEFPDSDTVEEATNKWSFTSKSIPDPHVDWSNLPIFDGEPVGIEEVTQTSDGKKINPHVDDIFFFN